MLNPSTADAEADDATTRRCIDLSNGWGFGAAVIVNLFGYISTDPKKLNSIDDPVGPDNNSVLLDQFKKIMIASLPGDHGQKLICFSAV